MKTQISVLRPEAIRDIERAIREKDEIIEKAQHRLLSQEDWSSVGTNRALQLTMLDRIVGDCKRSKGGYKHIIANLLDVDDFVMTCQKNYRPDKKNPHMLMNQIG
jgi:hypothetical protein